MRFTVASRAAAFTASALLLVTLMSAPAPAFASATLGLSAGTFKFQIDAGKKADGEVVVMNDGDQMLHVMVYAADQKIDAKGSVNYVTPTHADLTSLSQPSSWTTIKMPANAKSLGNVPYLDLAPGGRVPVKFSVLVPAEVTPGDHNVVIFFETFEPPKGNQGTQSVVTGRLGARVTLRVNGALRDKLEVSPFRVPGYVIGDKIPYDITVHDVGNTDQRLGGRIRLFDHQDTELIRQTAIDGTHIFAGATIQATGTIVAGDKFPGAYRVSLDVTPVDDTGKATNAGNDTITLDRTVYLIPVWSIIAALVVALAIIGWIGWAMASRSRRRRTQLEEAAYKRGLGDAAAGAERSAE